jgi:hypothetical protein
MGDYNLINHHQSPGLCMLDALHVAKDIDTVPLVQAAVDLVSVGCSGGRCVGTPWLEKEYVCTSVLGAKVNMAEDTRADAGLSPVNENQARVDIYDGRALGRQLADNSLSRSVTFVPS